jgi:NADPH:quinone reductase
MVKESRGVVLDAEYKTSIDSLPLRDIGEGDVLIKIHSSAINPSDKMYIQGRYPANKHLPTIAGFEGSGLVVETGSSEAAVALKGKRVCFFTSGAHDLGAWGEHTVVNSRSAFPIPDGISYEQGACFLVNPLTVQAFIVTCQEKGYKTIVHSAAASALGKMLVNACKKYDITLINIVRRPEQVQILKELGVEPDHILNSSDEAYETDLSYRLAQLKPSAFFDAVGGKTGSFVLTHMPEGSTTYNYGALEQDPSYKVGPMDLIFKQKILTGYWLTAEIRDAERAAKIFSGAFENLAGGLYLSTIAKTFPFDQYQEAIKYNNENQSDGKTLIQNPSFDK